MVLGYFGALPSLDSRDAVIYRARNTKQGRRELWAVDYTSPQSFMITLSYSLTTMGTFIEF